MVNSCSNIATNNPTYLWDFPGATSIPSGATTSITPIGIVYSTPGTYTITLTVTNECGSTPSTRTFTVKPLPTATISGGSTVCQNAPSPTITFVAPSNTAAAPYTTSPPYIFTYTIFNGSTTTTYTATALTSDTVTVSAPTGTAGTFV